MKPNNLTACKKGLTFGLSFLLTLFSLQLTAQETEKMLLSGKDSKHTVDWDFYCTGGRNSGYWTKIAVPAHWEQEGFGTYNYGRDYVTYGRSFRFADEKGMYKRTFEVPADWSNKKVEIVFEGSMTDTEVKINGQLAGEIHQGAFYRFKYDITDKLKFGEENLIEVTVSKMSADHSVNRAERYADYWIFGGIFRPVYLQALPQQHIQQAAIIAEADGSFATEVTLNGLKKNAELQAIVTDSKGQTLGTITEKVKKGNSTIRLSRQFDNIQAWTSETPHLYHVQVALVQNGETIHTLTERFGFRTIEIKEGDGIYLNGTKIKLKGVNRHAFWPETGRSLTPEIDLNDVLMIKEMNMNAVRMSHYPPDPSFLDYCDSLGLYVMDELAGWQNAYNTEPGAKLVKELVERDLNHPSIIFWSNGNEGGTNKELDDDFDLYDPSKRPVLHAHHRPGNAHNGIDTDHYENYKSLQNKLKDSLIYMPTEFLHGQDDGGGASGLSDYWELMWDSKMSGGGFLWVLADEGIIRTDIHNKIDVNRLNAPDGLVGPFRQKEGSFYAIREIYSPIKIHEVSELDAWDGTLEMENRYHFTNLNEINFEWKLVTFKGIGAAQTGLEVISSGELKGPDLAPTDSTAFKLPLPANWKAQEALMLTAYDPQGEEIYTWSWPLQPNKKLMTQTIMADQGKNDTAIEDQDSLLTISGGGFALTFNKADGMLVKIKKPSGPELSFQNGPVFTEGSSQVTEVSYEQEGKDAVFKVNYEGPMNFAEWRIASNGWVTLNYEYELPEGKYAYPGISFDYPESNVISAKWLGKGPYRVWKNRPQGRFNQHQNLYNDTHTGATPWDYPEFKGYFGDVAWMEINTAQGKFYVVAKERNLYVRLFDFYGISGPRGYPTLPSGDISFLDGIPALGSKLALGITGRASVYGPMGENTYLNGPVNRTLYFYFGILQE
ncbi:glycoside hydrolase family 2 TIM barrel-domain containing protein [Echinicola sp. 20G]|uniref:glycoside hydrolase family 2 TIM barrel-domain containing protein n=1 Tax=Echinicola sp. 20G TaxID=2781961 RepID=UPI0019111C39|nr:glycoside hydrolase family 2 TIM barrel-domain containing protein [Echinicola sp. 20G]